MGHQLEMLRRASSERASQVNTSTSTEVDQAFPAKLAQLEGTFSALHVSENPRNSTDMNELHQLLHELVEWADRLPDRKQLLTPRTWMEQHEKIGMGWELDIINPSVSELITEEIPISHWLRQIKDHLEDSLGSHESMEPLLKRAGPLVPLVVGIAAFVSNKGEARTADRLISLFQKMTADSQNSRGRLFGTKKPFQLGEIPKVRMSRLAMQVHGPQEGPLPLRAFEIPSFTSSMSEGQPLTHLLTGQPLHATQQLTIHVGEQQTAHARNVEFVKQFEQLIGKSQFQIGKNHQQLTIKFHPESLGKLEVQLIRENGLLDAKIMTTTRAAREMIEAQLPQLRHAFTQQQLPVERLIVEYSGEHYEEEAKREGGTSSGETYDNDEEREEEENQQLDSFDEWLKTIMNEEAQVRNG